MINTIILTIVLIGIGAADIFQIFSYAHNRKRRARIVIVLSLFGMLFTQAAYGTSSPFGQLIMVIWGIFLLVGVIGNYINS